MNYDFNKQVSRRGTGSLKWNVGEDELPMWVADMDFETAPCVIEALKNRVEHGIFGYTEVPDEWYEAYGSWWKRRHDFELRKEWLMFCTGVIPAISSIVRKLTTPNEKVIIQTPVYNIFFNSIENNGARVQDSPLKYDNGIFDMDLDDLERKMADPQASLMLLCNPQNPTGKIWTREQLCKIGELAAKYHVTVVSDEIHCDITDPDSCYIPFASCSEECRKVSITCIAPTKAFNIAGLQTAAISVPDPFLRHKVWRAINTDEVAEPNVFACAAAIAAFNEGEEWLDKLRSVIYENKKLVYSAVEKDMPKLYVIKGKATYLLWIDISAFNMDSKRAAAFIREKTGLFLSYGSQYGGVGDSFLRMNLACPKSLVMDGLDRLKKAYLEIIKDE